MNSEATDGSHMLRPVVWARGSRRRQRGLGAHSGSRAGGWYGVPRRVHRPQRAPNENVAKKRLFCPAVAKTKALRKQPVLCRRDFSSGVGCLFGRRAAVAVNLGLGFWECDAQPFENTYGQGNPVLLAKTDPLGGAKASVPTEAKKEKRPLRIPRNSMNHLSLHHT